MTFVTDTILYLGNFFSEVDKEFILPTTNLCNSSEWIASPEDNNKVDNEKNVANPVQSDTITYRRRRPPPVLPKPKIQNIEEYLQRRNRDVG